MTKRTLTAADWLAQMEAQPESVAELLAYETRVGHLVLDRTTGCVWNGGIGQGFGTSFKLITRTHRPNLMDPALWEPVNAHTVVAPLGAEASMKAEMFRLNNVALARVIAEAQRIIQGRIEDGIPE
jgi:hypothetical protein